MSLWNTIRRRFTLKDGASFAAFFGGGSWANKAVTVDTALQLSTVWACTRLKSQTLSTLPMGFFEKKEDGSRVDAAGHWLADILEHTPNHDQTPVEFWEGAHACVSLRGNFFARKAGLRGPVASRQFASLETMHPDSTTIRREGGEVRFDWRDPDGKVYSLPEEEVFHLKGFSLGEALGRAPIYHGRQTFGSALSADEQAAKMFASGLAQAGFLSVDQELKAPQRKDLQRIMDEYVGSSNAGKLMILEAGMKYVPLSLKPEEAQLLLTRRFHIEEICRWFDVPPMLVGHAGEGQTMWGTGVEQLFLAWLILGLRPALVRTEQAITKRLLPAKERRIFYAEHNVEGLLRADSAGRAAIYGALIQNAGATPNELRAKENLPPDKAGNDLLVSANLVRLKDLGTAPDPAKAAREAFRAWLLDDQKRDLAA